MECSAGNAVNLTFLWSDPLQVHLQRKNPGGVAFPRQGFSYGRLLGGSSWNHALLPLSPKIERLVDRLGKPTRLRLGQVASSADARLHYASQLAWPTKPIMIVRLCPQLLSTQFR